MKPKMNHSFNMLVKTYYFQINKSFKKTTYTIILSESITSMDDIIWKDINYRKQIFSSPGLKTPMTFSDRLLSVVRLSFRKLITFSSFSHNHRNNFNQT